MGKSAWCRIQDAHFWTILYNFQMDRITCTAQETTGYTVNSLVRGSKYPCWRMISSTHIGQDTVVFNNSFTPHSCIFWHKSSKSNSWAFLSCKISFKYTIILKSKSYVTTWKKVIDINQVRDSFLSLWYPHVLVEFYHLKNSVEIRRNISFEKYNIFHSQVLAIYSSHMEI